MILTILDVTYKIVCTVGTVILVIPVVLDWLRQRKQ